MKRDKQRLLTGIEIDELFRYPQGRAARLAKQGKLPSIVLPDGSIRFSRNDIEAVINSRRTEKKECR